ncbi:MAG TPA: hypothetical protein VLW26_03725 [Steroidobacteraceae bacterium]|nr:hypothetical protein [Steroidobacteraceae bacterium]
MNRALACFVASACIAALASGCASIGPGTIPRDRFDYGAQIGDSWKEQTLLNLVKLRYYDMPVFVEVAQVVGGYTLQTGVAASVAIPRNPTQDWTLSGTGTYSDHPTITYTPLTGNQFLRTLMMPVPPDSLMFTVQSNWPADIVFRLCVASVNGLRNGRISGGNSEAADPEFVQLVRILSELQRSGNFGMRIREGKGGERSTILFLHRDQASAELREEAATAKRLLGLNPDETEFHLVYGSLPASNDEIALQTRSMLHVMLEVGGMIDIPDRDIQTHVATAGVSGLAAEAQSDARLLRVHTSDSRPAGAFSAVRYHDHWFYLDDTDLRSKGTFTFLMLLFTLLDTSERQPLPLITIPAG